MRKIKNSNKLTKESLITSLSKISYVDCAYVKLINNNINDDNNDDTYDDKMRDKISILEWYLVD